MFHVSSKSYIVVQIKFIPTVTNNAKAANNKNEPFSGHAFYGSRFKEN